MACIAAESDELALRHWTVERREAGIGHTGLVGILILAEGRLDAGRERLQVAIDGGIALRMGDVDCIAETVEALRDATHVAVADGIDVLALHIIGRDVESAVEVVRAGLAKITRQRDVVIHRRGLDA